MGRRSLGKINPTLDFGKHLLVWDDLPQPWDPHSVVGGDAPLEIEVGTGKGLFLTGAAATFPDRRFIGIEIVGRYARFSAAKLAERNIDNARVLHADAVRVFRERVPDRSLAAVHVYFPDPWWKKRHHKRRVMTAEFVADIQRTLAIDGKLHFWTDVEEYFQASLEVLVNQQGLSGPFEVAQQDAQHDLDYRTHFERRKRLDGLPVYRAEFVKTP